MREILRFRQRSAAYVLRQTPSGPEVLVILHQDSPEAGVQVPGGGALPHETIGEAAIREALEETGVRGLVFGEVLGNKLARGDEYPDGYQVTSYSWLRTEDSRDAWDHTITSADEDCGMRMRCEFRPVASAGIDWDMDVYLERALRGFEVGLPVALPQK
ncbi:NUDIX domain-containing protein [Glycomyces sp. NPDC046736]|uniref:NUDIX domain-containing protein n=1 Tax=Glycomyces sp. NPDC046736 TaxID=3155615 RepID=UPI0033EF4676